MSDLSSLLPDSPISPPIDRSLTPAGSAPAPAVELLPDPILPALTRPLALAGPRTYAAIWPYVRRAASSTRPAPVARELALVGDDGLLCLSGGTRAHLTVDPLSATDVRPPLTSSHPLFADTSLSLDHAPLPLDRFWSDRGLNSYLAGRRPDPVDLFRRLVAVLSHFVDFSGLSGPDQNSSAELLAVYVLATWFAPVLPALGFLWLVGDHGSGKSRLLYLLARLSHLGLLLPTLPSAPALATLCGLGAAVAVDDAMFLSAGPTGRFRGVGPARRALLLAGRQRGALLPVTRRVAGAPARAALVDVSGPRLFACLHPPDPFIAVNCIVFSLQRTVDDARAALDPADPAAWPPGLALRDLVDDLWALALARLTELPPHVRHSALSTSGLRQSFSHQLVAPLPGAAYQPWHALFAVASWLTAQGVSGLSARLVNAAHAYRDDHLPFETTDLNTLVLRGLFECANAYLLRYPSLTRPRDARDAPGAPGGRDARDAHDMLNALDADIEIVAPTFFPFTSSQVLLAVQRLAANEGSEISAARLTPSVVGQLLNQLGLSRYRTNQRRMWSLSPSQLSRLARAYGQSLPPELAVILDQAAPLPADAAPP